MPVAIAVCIKRGTVDRSVAATFEKPRTLALRIGTSTSVVHLHEQGESRSASRPCRWHGHSALVKAVFVQPRERVVHQLGGAAINH
jgi:hypothetical protein